MRFDVARTHRLINIPRRRCWWWACRPVAGSWARLACRGVDPVWHSEIREITKLTRRQKVDAHRQTELSTDLQQKELDFLELFPIDSFITINIEQIENNCKTKQNVASMSGDEMGSEKKIECSCNPYTWSSRLETHAATRIGCKWILRARLHRFH